MNAREATIALNMLPKIGPVRVRRLLEYFGNASEILHASEHALTQVAGIGNETANVLNDWESHIDLSAELADAKERDIQIVTEEDEDYPESLRNMYDPPLALYVWGELSSRDKHAISIVGSRKTTIYGRETARKVALELASAGFTIISGMARGIDTYAHEGAVAANGRTIAVLGSGLGQIYPPENMALAEKIASGQGAVISEFPLNTFPDKRTFPMRNRIVAAWGNALVVVECPQWSGSMITANLAIDMGKSIYAVPGPIDRPSSAGCNLLIRNGATLLSQAGDIIEDFSQLPLVELPQCQRSKPMGMPVPELNEDEKLILKHLAGDDLGLDQLVALTGLAIPQLLPTLLKLEMKKCIHQLPGPRYKIASMS